MFAKAMPVALVCAFAVLVAPGCFQRIEQFSGDAGPACPEGQEWCGEECVDPRSDSRHCGGCGRTCSPGLTCQG